FQSHARDLWIGEDGVWYRVVVHLDPSLQDRVVVDYLGFVVRDVFEEVTSVCVAKGPDVWLRSLKVFVDRDPTVFGDAYLCFLGMQDLRNGASPCRDQDLVGFHLSPSSTLSISRGQAFVTARRPLHRLHLMTGQNLDVSPTLPAVQIAAFIFFFRW